VCEFSLAPLGPLAELGAVRRYWHACAVSPEVQAPGEPPGGGADRIGPDMPGAIWQVIEGVLDVGHGPARSEVRADSRPDRLGRHSPENRLVTA
jgi:hypothetical protein